MTFRPTPNYPKGPTCIECGKMTNLVGGLKIYPHRPDLASKRFWLCDCGAYCGCHGNTSQALGFPAGPETRKARSAAHAAFDPLWKSGKMTRRKAYELLSAETMIPPEQAHIGMMTAEEAWRVVYVCKKIGDI